MLASRADIVGPLAGSSPLVEEFIEKPFFLDEAVTRIKRVLNRITLSKAAREGADSTSVRGTLAQMSVVDLLQTLDIGQKSCRLELRHAGQQSEMQFLNGQMVHATLGNLTGEAAVYEVVAWTEGVFLIDFERVECPRTITHSTQSVLLEALRRFDESQRDVETRSCSNPRKPAATLPSRTCVCRGFRAYRPERHRRSLTLQCTTIYFLSIYSTFERLPDPTDARFS